MPPKKRKIAVSQRSAFYRQNCKTDCIQCDAFKQWYHAQCEDLSVVEENANVDECWIHVEDTLKCNTLFKKSKLSLSTLLTQRFCIDLVVNFVSQCALSCILEFVKKGRHLF